MRFASSTEETAPSEPGMTGTPAAFMVSLALALSPSMAMDSGDGPMKVMPLSMQSCANSALSDKKPKPGCSAEAPVFWQAAMRAFLFR